MVTDTKLNIAETPTLQCGKVLWRICIVQDQNITLWWQIPNWILKTFAMHFTAKKFCGFTPTHLFLFWPNSRQQFSESTAPDWQHWRKLPGWHPHNQNPRTQFRSGWTFLVLAGGRGDLKQFCTRVISVQATSSHQYPPRSHSTKLP